LRITQNNSPELPRIIQVKNLATRQKKHEVAKTLILPFGGTGA